MKKFSAFMTAVLSLALCAGCSFIFPSPDDTFPYDVAERRGEYGSEESWLASLDAPSTQFRRAYLEAVEDGSFSGTYLDFLARVGVDNGSYVQRALRSVVSVYATFRSASKSYYSAGSGVIYSLDRDSGDAYIVTNYHVVYDAESVPSGVSSEIKIYLYGQEYEESGLSASFLGGAMEYDLAVLRVENFAELADTETYVEAIAANSDVVAVGDKVYAVGNADADGISVTAGIVSVDAEYIEITAADGRTELMLLEIRSDVAVNHGNSGGGLFNDMGELIGIVNARAEGEDEFIDGFGYAIPVNLAFAVAQNIIDTCLASPNARCAAVARFAEVEAADGRAVFNEETGRMYLEEKVVVSRIEVNSIADRAGLKRADTLISAKLISQGETVEVEITRTFKIENLLPTIRRGDTLELTVSRDGQLLTVTLDYAEGSAFRAVR